MACRNCGCTDSNVRLRHCRNCGYEYCERCVGYECTNCRICEDKISIFSNWRSYEGQIKDSRADQGRCRDCGRSGDLQKCRRCG